MKNRRFVIAFGSRPKKRAHFACNQAAMGGRWMTSGWREENGNAANDGGPDAVGIGSTAIRVSR
ncbi:MAG: hypothetical protein EPO03_00190, partial [Porticoccaceae bacterium]